MAPHSITSNGKGMLENCTVRNIELVETDVRNCTLHNVKLKGCHVFNSKLYDCKPFDSAIKCSQFFETEPHETRPEPSKTSQLKLKTSSSVFVRLAAELREQIFEYCLYFENQRNPELLVALRGDRLYLEAIEIFYKINPFPFSSDTLRRCSGLSNTSLSKIRNVHIDCDHLPRPPLKYSQIPRAVIERFKITQVLLHGSDPHSVSLWAIETVFTLKRVKKLTIINHNLSNRPRFRPWKGIMERLDKNLNATVETPTPNEWVWSAPDGMVLEWSTRFGAGRN